MPTPAPTVVGPQGQKFTTTDVAVVGGGPAGLSAALVLGRSRRRVVVFDSGEYRNAGVTASHGWLTRDGVSPDEMRRLGREEVLRYGGKVAFARVSKIAAAKNVDGGFWLTSGPAAAPSLTWAKAVVLATGLRDVFPAIPGLQELVGRGVCVCPYCDAYEVRDQPIGVAGENGAGLALSLRTWSSDVVLFTDGRPTPASMLADLRSVNVRIVDTPIHRLVSSLGGGGVVRRLVAAELADGTSVRLAALFVKLVRQERSDLARQLGLAGEGADITADRQGATSVPGVWVAGDASRDLLFASVAAAEGAAVAVAVNHALQLEGWGLR